MRPRDTVPLTITLGDLVLHDLDAVCDLLGMNRTRLERYLRADALAAVMHGGRWMVAEEEVQRFRDWTPPKRAAGTGVRQRFRPPSRPAPATQAS